MKTTLPENICSTSNQVFHFVSSEIFEDAKSQIKGPVMESINATVLMYKAEIINLLHLLLPKLADGFATQRGKIFGFGPEAANPTTTFKISAATENELIKLNSTSVHNLGEERSVGSINHELGIRGKRNLEAASKKHVLNKSFDLLERSGKLSDFANFRKAADDIKFMRIEWNEKMKKMEEEGNIQRDLNNSHIESIKYSDLEFLKRQNGPFTTAEEVREFDNSTPESVQKKRDCILKFDTQKIHVCH